MRILQRLLLMIIGVGFVVLPARAQLQVKPLGPTLTPEQIVSTLLGGGITVLNVEYIGATNASGVFCSGDGIIGFDTGILLTSGDAVNVIGPNDSSGKSTDNGLPGDTDLATLIPGFENLDASVLQITFIPTTSEVQFNYVFSSEEYNEFVNSSFNDVFGFFVNGVNYALIPGTATPVSINNVNNGNSSVASGGPCVNCQFYVDNVGSNLNLNTQMDGLTVVLPMIAPVNAGTVNTIKIAIADAGDHALDSAVFIQAGSFKSGTVTGCVTRTAQYWFSHHDSEDPSCVSLKNALANVMNVNCDSVPLGFIDLPIGYRNDDNVRDATDAMIEALGLYWRSGKKTGELAGTQNEKRKGSLLCTERKRLATELVAAWANTALFGTDPGNCTYNNLGVPTAFPSNLVQQARSTAAGDDVTAIRTMTAILRLFNASGQTNDFPAGLFQCESATRKELKTLSRDPTTQLTCPGSNDGCQPAEAIVFPNANDIFSTAQYKRSVSLIKYTNTLPGSACGAGGREAVWKITPAVGQTGRRFTASTFGSNFDTMISIWEGDCDALVPVDCNDNASPSRQSEVSFTTDGTNTFYIVVEGQSGEYGKAKLKVTSP